MKKKIVCLIGPTAVGKTDIAVKLAKKINAEIISCDSMQIYKGAGITSSQPTKGQRKEVSHHLIGILSPSREYSAAHFRESAQKVIDNIHQREKIPLIVAGTGLYLRVLLDGLFFGPGRNVSLRKKFYQQAKKYGRHYLYRRLKKKDPKSANSIHPNDLRRIVRALEVYEKTKTPISKLRENTYGIRDRYDLYIFGLRRPRSELYDRINQRVDEMFRRGLVAEMERLTKNRVSKTAKSLLGYKEIKGFLKGDYSLDEAKRLLKRNTRRYAKRQISWFRKEKGVKWIGIDSKDNPKVVIGRIVTFLV